jgi:hypothetical protein
MCVRYAASNVMSDGEIIMLSEITNDDEQQQQQQRCHGR